ncbi:MAG: 16S rRNA (adenine(1518)-N(6)/adenine(1519)-N(6))-dimethyltransferase RsmA [Flavobacteriales bacterium]|nr:16S rRNA (adenine(1518)-N(6)/adenine(1519)-N(6))-dimethyltransferase RsmA [Flavobacteriales bacterium]
MAGPVRAKKHLGQHFLRDEEVAKAIVDALPPLKEEQLIEIGPGDGVLSKYLLERYPKVKLFDVDLESIAHLKEHFPMHRDQVIAQDFLQYDIEGPHAIIGNFPYNISSQIVFKMLERRTEVTCLVGMFQKEVAQRIASKEGSRVYGILSVLTQAFYDVEYLFTVDARSFEPAPKVESGVLRMIRKDQIDLACDEKQFFSIVKRGFNQRRKMIRKSLKDLIPDPVPPSIEKYLTMRPEQLHYSDFVTLTLALAPSK